MADHDPASGAAAAAEGRPTYLFGAKGRAFLSSVPLGGLANATASVRLGLPEWEALIPLLSELGADLSAVYASVAIAQADMLRTRATEAPRAAVEDVLRQVLEARSETLLPLAAAVIRRLGVDSLPRDIIDLAGKYNKLPAVLDDASKRALLARSKASFLGHVRDELARFLGSSMNAVARFCVVSFNVGLEPGSKMSRTVDEIASACAAAGPLFASEALNIMVDIHMHSGFRALAAIRAAVGAHLSRKHAHVDPLAALCRACHVVIMAKDVNPTSLKAVMDALQVLVTAREAGLRRKAQEQARAAVSTKSSSGGRKPAFSASVASLGAAVRESCRLVRRRVDKHGHYFAPVTTLWPQLKDTYTLKVPTPMDFGTISRKSDSYATKEAAEADARLVYQNSELFNGRQHQITVAARRCTDEFIKALGPLAREAESKQQLAEAASEVGTVAADGVSADSEANALLHARCVLSDPCFARVVLRAAADAAAACARSRRAPAQVPRMRHLAQATAAVCSGTIVAPSQAEAASGAQAAPVRVWAALTWAGTAVTSAEAASEARAAAACEPASSATAAAAADSSASSSSSSGARADPAQKSPLEAESDAHARLAQAARRAVACGAEGAGLLTAVAAKWQMLVHRPEARRAALAVLDGGEACLAVLPFVVSSFTQAHAEAVRGAGSERRKLPATDSISAAAAAAAAAAKPRDPLAEADAQVSDAAFLVDIWFPRLLDRLTTVPPSAASLAAGATSPQLVVPDHLIAMCHDRAASFLVLLLDAGDSVRDALRSRVRHFLELFVKAASSDGWTRGSRFPEPVTDDTIACAAQPAFDGPLMTSARQQYDRLCLALDLDRLPLGLRNPMPLA